LNYELFPFRCYFFICIDIFTHISILKENETEMKSVYKATLLNINTNKIIMISC